MSDDEELLYGLLGTQFNTDADEQTEFKRSKLKRKAADEEVVDAKGRATRFHGAFTGGFSAGYFNTVGSKEGFQPSEFVSQGKVGPRNFRATKPEDYMDEDDFGENGIAPRLLRAKSMFDNEDIRKHMKQSLGSHNVVGDSDILKDILVPQSVTIGLMLLRKLGYLASRGIGEKSNITSSEIEDEDALGMTKFDYEAEEIFQLIPKADRFGLGYSGMCRSLITAKATNDNQAVTFGLKNKKGIRGMAFSGVDNEDDDEDIRDIYVLDSMSKYNFEVVEDEKDTNFGWTAPKHIKNAIMPSDSIPGFQMGSKCSKSSRINYEPLVPPRFFIPIYPIRKAKENTEQKGRPERPKLMPNEDKGSVFSLLSSSDRERLHNMGKENVSRKSGSRWGDVPSGSKAPMKEEVRDIEANLTSIRNSIEPPSKFVPKKESRKTWSFDTNLSSKFKSAGSSTSNQDMDHQLQMSIKTDNDLQLSTKEMAANAETYGFMTRTILPWHPDKLLCKRFNVPDPFPGSKIVGVPDEIEFPTEKRRSCYTAKTESETPMLELEESSTDMKTEPDNKISQPEPDSEERSVVAIITTVPDLSNKPPIDLFKAVFDDSDADFSSSEDEEEKKEESTKTVAEKSKEEKPISFLSSMEQALGAMFGGISQKVNPPPVPSVAPQKENPRIFGPTPPPDFVFNPVIPDSSSKSLNDIISKNIPKIIHPMEIENESYVYLEKSKSKKAKHEKKSKKDKKSKSVKKDRNKKKNKKKKNLSGSDASE